MFYTQALRCWVDAVELLKTCGGEQSSGKRWHIMPNMSVRQNMIAHSLFTDTRHPNLCEFF